MAVLHEHFDSVKFLSVHWPFPLLDFKCLLHGYSLVPFEKLFSAEKSTLPNRLAASLATWLPEMRQHSNIQCLDLSSIDTDPDGTCSFAQASINSLGVCEEDVELLVGQILCRQIPFLSEPKGRTIRVNLCCTTDRYIGEAKALLIMDALTVKQYAPINLHCRGLIMTETIYINCLFNFFLTDCNPFGN
uniref:Uncharacterized protein LOC102801603 n=1 Tax=Saccoglossus kowalevskii TaxID=10224 RepID=A0ABM0MF95_SACKO|nr:PREDICTED: uncharacterized protein LOC102801603 [Saccoglossus kowalevskii]